MAERASMRPALIGFLEQFPQDGLAPLARAYFAWIALDANQLEEAHRLLSVTVPPRGAATELSSILKARWLRLTHHPREACRTLETITSAVVDPTAQITAGEEQTRCSFESAQWKAGFVALERWVRRMTFPLSLQWEETIHRALAGVPEEVLMQQFVQWTPKAKADRAVHAIRVAILHKQEESASQRLNDKSDFFQNPFDLARTQEQLTFAQRRSDVDRVNHRTVGILFSSRGSLSQPSAEVLQGIVWALSQQQKGSTLSGIHLVVRDDEGDPKKQRGLLNELAGEGASILVGGMDTAGTDTMLAWAETRGISVLALATPSSPTKRWAFGFLIESLSIQPMPPVFTEPYVSQPDKSPFPFSLNLCTSGSMPAPWGIRGCEAGIVAYQAILSLPEDTTILKADILRRRRGIQQKLHEWFAW